MVQLCTTVDAWCPGAQQFDVGRRCLGAILDQILTKNAAVMRDFDLLQEHRDRVVLGLLSLVVTRKDFRLSDSWYRWAVYSRTVETPPNGGGVRASVAGPSHS